MTATPTQTASSPAEDHVSRVLVVDDHPILREGVRRRIERQPDMEVCGEAGSASAALEICRTTPCDAAVIDISIEGRSGIELIGDLRREGYEFPITVLSVHDSVVYAERALAAGAQGYVLKQEAPRLIIDALRQIIGGQVYVCPAMSSKLLSRMVGRTAGARACDPIMQLSNRELEVLEAIGRGRGTKDIASDLNVGVSTVETHRARIKMKLGFDSASALAAFAARWLLAGSTSPEREV